MESRWEIVLATDYPGNFDQTKLNFYEGLRKCLKGYHGANRELFVPPVDFPNLSPYIEGLLGRRLEDSEVLNYFFEVVVIRSKLVLCDREIDCGFSDSIVRRALAFDKPVIGFHNKGTKPVEKDLFRGLETVTLNGNANDLVQIERRVKDSY